MTTALLMMRMARAPFAFLLLAGLSWASLWTLNLPPIDQLSWIQPPETFSRLRPPPRDKQLRNGKPLRQTNLEILRNATSIDLKFVDVSNNYSEHPHRGARDEHGNWGFVHDETALRRSPPPLNTERLQQDCQERDSNYIMMTKRVFVDQEAHNARADTSKRAKILCIIYSTEVDHKEKIPAIRETWG
jgi:hypothetical protein